jgi:hypothetical protein
LGREHANEFDVLLPVALLRGYRYGMTMTIDDLDVLKVLWEGCAPPAFSTV